MISVCAIVFGKCVSGISFFNCEYMPVPDGDETSEHQLLQKMDPYGGDLLFKGR